MMLRTVALAALAAGLQPGAAQRGNSPPADPLGILGALRRGIPERERTCLPSCAGLYEECGRDGTFRQCCSSDHRCVFQNQFYAQCLPAQDYEQWAFSRPTVEVCETILGGRDNPLQSPTSLRDLGVQPPPPASSQMPLVQPYWLNMSDPVAANCNSCLSRPGYRAQADEPMFVYTQLCFLPSNRTQRARVSTKHGEDGPVDTTLFVFNEARTTTRWDDNSLLVCSDGSQPSTNNCPNQICQSQHDKCVGDAQLYSLSQVDITVPPGSVPQCFKAAIGTKKGGDKVGNVGLDVLMDYED